PVLHGIGAKRPWGNREEQKHCASDRFDERGKFFQSSFSFEHERFHSAHHGFMVLWFEKRWVMLLPHQGPADSGQQMIVIGMAHIEREIAIDALERAGTVQAPRSAGPDALFYRVLRQVLHDVARTAAR